MGIARAAVGLIAGAGLVGAGYAGLGGQDNTTRDEAGQIVEGGDVGAFRIRVGDCFNSADTEEIEEVEGVPCTVPHEGEAYFAFMLPEGNGVFPGDASISNTAQDRCLEEFQPFVGTPYETSEFGFWTLRPSEGSWDVLDDREVLCIVANYDGTMKTGSAKDAGT